MCARPRKVQVLPRWRDLGLVSTSVYGDQDVSLGGQLSLTHSTDDRPRSVMCLVRWFSPDRRAFRSTETVNILDSSIYALIVTFNGAGAAGRGARAGAPAPPPRPGAAAPRAAARARAPASRRSK